MKNLTPTIIHRKRNQIRFSLGGSIEVIAVSFGEADRHNPHHEITLTFVDTDTGEYPVLPLNGIDYTLWYATGRVFVDRRAQATKAEIRRSEEGYFGTPPTDKARSAAWALVRDILNLIVEDDYFGEFLNAGEQKKRYRRVQHLQTEINNLKDEYSLKIRELLDSIDDAGNLNDFDLSFPHPEWVSR